MLAGRPDAGAGEALVRAAADADPLLRLAAIEAIEGADLVELERAATLRPDAGTPTSSASPCTAPARPPGPSRCSGRRMSATPGIEICWSHW
jgi:hypothetical protein